MHYAMIVVVPAESEETAHDWVADQLGNGRRRQFVGTAFPIGRAGEHTYETGQLIEKIGEKLGLEVTEP